MYIKNLEPDSPARRVRHSTIQYFSFPTFQIIDCAQKKSVSGGGFDVMSRAGRYNKIFNQDYKNTPLKLEKQNMNRQAVNNVGWERMKQGDLTQKGNSHAMRFSNIVY